MKQQQTLTVKTTNIKTCHMSGFLSSHPHDLFMPSRLTQVVTLLTCTRGIIHLHLGWDTSYQDLIFSVVSFHSFKGQNSTYISHDQFPSKFFKIYYSPITSQSQILRAS
jgi:hypothetical protein